jgi:NitT/TauT family transport system ATP-binding protein
MPALVEAVDLVKRYGDLLVLDNISFTVAHDEFVSLVGASGCGKSTILGLVAGLTEPTSGTVLLDGQPVVGPGLDRGLVFQNYSLYPWRTVRENVAFGLELQKLPKPEIRERVDHLLDAVGLLAFADALPRALSGGMRQRVAIARALATDPQILLLDEPLGALDSPTRSLLQDFLRDTWLDPLVCDSVMLVTHDVEEAVYLSERIYVLASHPGRIVEEITVPFDRDRDQTVLQDPRFTELVAQVRGRLRDLALEAQQAAAQRAAAGKA